MWRMPKTGGEKLILDAVGVGAGAGSVAAVVHWFVAVGSQQSKEGRCAQDREISVVWEFQKRPMLPD